MSATDTFYLKYRDLKPDLVVNLKNPDGTAFSLSGSTGWKLHVWLSDGTKLSARDMAKVGDDADGQLKYVWKAADWVDALVPSPTLPFAVGEVDHRMEYEVIYSSFRYTFPNDGYHTLRILADIGEGT